jgi:hypothetical protein
MSRRLWARRIKDYTFNIKTYRRFLAMILGSVLLNVLLILLISYSYLTQGAAQYYSTDGVTMPVELKPLAHPNESSTPLLPPGPPVDNKIKIIPE